MEERTEMTRAEKKRLEREAKQKKVWTTFSAVFLALLVISFGWLTFSIARLNMLPTKIMWVLAGVLVLAAFLFGVWIFAPMKKGKGKVRRVLAFVTALAFSIGGFAASGVINKAYETMRAVTNVDEDAECVGVYVMANDSAQTLEDARDYTFAATASYDWKNTQAAMEAMGDELGTPLAMQMFDSVAAMVDALYNGDVSALIVNQAYVSILEDMEAYEMFSTDTRLLYEYKIPKAKPSLFNKGSDAKGGLNDPFTLYISGSDARSEYLSTSRSDVNILITVNPKTKQVLLVNTPRDYYIPNPAAGGDEDKLTHCGIYGVETSIQALADLYDVEVPYYAQINFTGFETLIDAIGGITVYSDTAYDTRHGNATIVEGENHLNGREALGFARERYALEGGDNDRGKNQMKVIEAVIDKLTSGALISNYSDVLDSLQGMFVTNVTHKEISSFVKNQLTGMTDWEVHSYAVTGSGGSNTTASAPGFECYVMYPHEDTVAHATELMDAVLEGETLTEADINGVDETEETEEEAYE